MKALIILSIIFSFNVYSYPIGTKSTGQSTTYPGLIDFGFLKMTTSGSTSTLTSIGAASGDSLVLGGTINANAVADFQSTSKAFMPPRMTTTQKNAISSPTAGMVVYDTTLNQLAFYNGTSWGSMGSLTNYDSTPGITNPKIFGFVVITTSGTVSNNYGSVVTSCTAANPTACTFTGLTATPVCSFSNDGDGTVLARVAALTSTGVTIRTVNSQNNTDVASWGISVTCIGY